MFKIIFLFLLVAATSTGIFSQSGSSASTFASVNIVTPVGTEKTGNLELNSFYPGPIAGTIVLNPGGDFKSTGEIKPIGEQHNYSPASLRIITNNYSFGFLIETIPLTLTRVSGYETMQVDRFTASTLEGKALENYYSIISIGASLKFGALQVPGIYITSSPLSIIINFE